MENTILCTFCDQTYQEKSYYTEQATARGRADTFCSMDCRKQFYATQSAECICTQCSETFKRVKSANRSKNVFCSQSCAAIYNNTHKTKGTRRSKLEGFIETELKVKYTTLQIDYNKTDAINAELDIFIPSLKLAFELNGIFHYEAIYGQDKLDRMRSNDKRKFQACLERSIELCIIDTSSQAYFKPQTAKKFLDIITSVINQNLARCEGIDPSIGRLELPVIASSLTA